MNQPKFTPGPWEIRGWRGLEGPTGPVQFSGDGISIAMSCPTDEQRANYALLKAAPALYEALKEVEWSDHGRCPQCGAEPNGHQPDCILGNALAKAVQP